MPGPVAAHEHGSSGQDGGNTGRRCRAEPIGFGSGVNKGSRTI